MSDYGYEIDFLPVGNGDKSGDAIALRYGKEGNYKVMIIDGGTKASGQDLVNHIKKYYKTNYVDFLVNTHPDADHASGLEVVLQQLNVGEVWVHRPWKYVDQIRHWFTDGRITEKSLEFRLKDLLSHSYQIETLANEKGISIYEPYAGAKIGDFTVLSPCKEWYLELVPQFNKTPSAYPNIFTEDSHLELATESWVTENWNKETLSKTCETSNENESSVVLYGNLNGNQLLFTGDAGIQALGKACDYADMNGLDLSACRFIQVPHHGSRNNISPDILNRLVGPCVPHGTHPNKTGFVSASKNSAVHPRRVVTNAFLRRGVKIHETKGRKLQHIHNMEPRLGWVSANQVQFHDNVEE